MEQDSQLNAVRLRELSELIDNGDKVNDVLSTEGWQAIIEPMLNKMIVDVLGGLENGRWHNGSLGDKRLGEVKLQVLCAYKRALTDFHSYIYQYVDNLPQYREEYEAILKSEGQVETTDNVSEYTE